MHSASSFSVSAWRSSPRGESLQDTSKRSIPYFTHYVLPELKAGKNILIVAHGNSLRSIVMKLEGLTPEQILKRDLATGVPLVYDLGKNAEVLSHRELV
jgi:2,3-bisphosphoglycerate-dependent phosphoglycerate mutase